MAQSKKTALIIGGSSGIGKATTTKLLSEGFDLTILHRDRRQNTTEFKEYLDDLNKKYPSFIETFNIDATNETLVNETIDSFKNKNFNIVLHAVSRGNLGNLTPGEKESLRPIDLQLTIDAMGINVLLWAQLLQKKNMIGKGSCFLTLSSEGKSKFLPGYAAVALAKSSLQTLTEYLAVEYSTFGIRFNCIIAGVIDTPSVRMMSCSEEILDKAKNRNPYNRLTTTEDVANVVYLFSQPEAGWVNGAMLHVDGGEHLI